MRVLGLDPGLRITGYGCIDAALPGCASATIVEAGVFRLAKPAAAATTAPRLSRTARPARPKARSIAERLVELEHDLVDLIERTKPELVGVEALFAHYKHPATAIAMGHARGVMLLVIRKKGLELAELRPAAVKRFLTGHGQAKKQQMQDAIQTHFRLATRPEPPDVADALAIALCAASRAR